MQGVGTLGLGLGLGLRKSRCHVASLEPVLRCSRALTLSLTLTLTLTRSSAGSLNLGLPLSGLQPDGSPRRSPRAAAHGGTAHAAAHAAAHGATGIPEQSSEQSSEQLLQVWAQLEGAEESDFVHNHRQSVGVKAHAAIVAELRGDRDKDRDRDRDGSLTPPRSSISIRDGSASASASGGSDISLAELKSEAAAALRRQAPPAPLLRRGSVVEREAAAWQHENRRWLDLVGSSHVPIGYTGPTLPSPYATQASNPRLADARQLCHSHA